MSEHKMPESDETRCPGGKAGERASSPSRRRAIKAALATAPVVMSLKSRSAAAASNNMSGQLSGQLRKSQ